MIVSYSGKIGSGKDLAAQITQYLTSPNIGSKGSFLECEQNGFVYDVIYENRKFADKLKDMVCLLLGCTREKLEERDFKEGILPEMWNKWKVGHDYKVPYSEMAWEQYYSTQQEAYQAYNKQTDTEPELVQMTPRLLLQLLGTECGRDILHPNIWVNALMSDYKPVAHKIPNSEEGAIYDSYNSAMDKDPNFENIYPNWVITDMRFPNEADAVKQRGGLAIRINRKVGKEVFPSENWGSNRVEIQKGKILEVGEGEYLIKSDCGREMWVYVDEVEFVRKQEHPSETGLDHYEDWDYIIDNDGSIEDLVESIREILQKENII